MSTQGALIPYIDDPSEIGFSRTFVTELVLRTDTVKNLCHEYRISQSEWDELRVNPTFIKAVTDANEELKKDGMSFRLKARLQSEELLKTSWAIIHSSSPDVTPTVKADLIKQTWRVAGLDASLDQKGSNPNAQANNLMININLR